MRIRLNGTSSLEASQLRAQKVNIKTSHCAQANISASKQVVASAIWRSTIYFYGEPSIISQYTSGSGLVLPMWNNSRQSQRHMIMPAKPIGPPPSTPPRGNLKSGPIAPPSGNNHPGGVKYDRYGQPLPR
jgi:hypothetical protein